MNRTEEQITVTITKVFYDGEFSHWEADCEYPDHGGSSGVSVTGPSSWGVLDYVTEHWWESPWFSDDSNARNR